MLEEERKIKRYTEEKKTDRDTSRPWNFNLEWAKNEEKKREWEIIHLVLAGKRNKRNKLKESKLAVEKRQQNIKS